MNASRTKISVAHYGPSTVLGSWDILMNKRGKNPCSSRAWLLDNKQSISDYLGMLGSGKCYEENRPGKGIRSSGWLHVCMFCGLRSSA